MIPRVGEPGKVMGVAAHVVVACQQCPKQSEVFLVNAQPAACPSCGALYSLDELHWQKGSATPKVRLTATAPAREHAFS